MASFKLLDAVSATGIGPSFLIGSEKSSNEGTKHRVYQYIISDTATVQLEGSLDNINWEPIGLAQTSSIGKEALHVWTYIRGNVTAYTSGTVTLIVAF